uniref:hypothetical protein n=1 Tax=Mucilaginibacter sp. TaxID=1882438 RepID=UPI00374D64AC
HKHGPLTMPLLQSLRQVQEPADLEEQAWTNRGQEPADLEEQAWTNRGTPTSEINGYYTNHGSRALS